MEQRVVLVDKNDHELGTEEKLRAHQHGGKLHRAISICIFNSKGEMMLQQRSSVKYHEPGKWVNTVCSHPMPDETPEQAVHRRLKEEMGFDCPMHEVSRFVYRVEVGNNLTENEYDHVFFGRYEGEPKPNPEEVQDWRWMSLDDAEKDTRKNPGKYAAWFRFVLREAKANLGKL